MKLQYRVCTVSSEAAGEQFQAVSSEAAVEPFQAGQLLTPGSQITNYLTMVHEAAYP